MRAQQRIREGRPKPVDILVAQLHLSADIDPGPEPPYAVFENLSPAQVQELCDDIRGMQVRTLCSTSPHTGFSLLDPSIPWQDKVLLLLAYPKATTQALLKSVIKLGGYFKLPSALYIGDVKGEEAGHAACHDWVEQWVHLLAVPGPHSVYPVCHCQECVPEVLKARWHALQTVRLRHVLLIILWM